MKIISHFTKEKIECRRDIQYLQVIWYELEYANCCVRLEKYFEVKIIIIKGNEVVQVCS